MRSESKSVTSLQEVQENNVPDIVWHNKIDLHDNERILQYEK